MNTTAVSSRLTRAARAIADPASFTDEELDTAGIVKRASRFLGEPKAVSA